MYSEPTIISETPVVDGPTPAAEDGASRRFGDATLVVEVPENARVYVNNRLTSTPGSTRKYVSRNLTTGKDYFYTVTAEVEKEGEVVKESQRVALNVGHSRTVKFNFASYRRDVEEPETSKLPEPAANPTTSLTLKVPADAEVTLGGNPTKAVGEVRTFSTTRLARGEKWGDYSVEVTVMRNGEPVSQTQHVSISGGQQPVLEFDFDAPSAFKGQ